MRGNVIEVIVYVKDMQRAVTFYRDTLGLTVSFPQGLRDYSGEYWVTLNTGGCTLALHGGSQGRSGPDAPKVVFEVEDIYAEREALVKQGVDVREIRTAAPDVLVVDGFDPDGNAFSLEWRVR